MTDTTTSTIRVLIADDHAIVREGLKQILADTSAVSYTHLTLPTTERV